CGIAVLLCGTAVLVYARQRSLDDQLRQAIVKDDAPAAGSLVRQGADVNTLVDFHGDFTRGDTALQTAVFRRNAGLVRELLDRGAKVNVECPKGTSPLENAAVTGDVEMMRLLIAGGANINHRDQGGDGSSPLDAAAYYGHAEAVRLLLAHGAVGV